MTSRALGVLAFLFVSLIPHPAAAQGQRDDPSALAAMRFGPLALTPTIAIRDLGMDSNTLGLPEGNPEFTMSFVPGARAWLTIGRVRLSSQTEVEWQYFQETEEQRSFGITEDARADLLLAYLTPYVSATYDNTKRRQTSEFDVRVRQKTLGYAVGAIIYPGPRTEIEVMASTEEYRLGEGNLGGVLLASQLDHDNRAAELKVGYAVTRLTKLATRLIAEEDRFIHSPVRDSDSWSVQPGLEFKASALVTGSAYVGYRSFRTLDPAARDFTGPVAEVSLKYVARDMTKIESVVNRDVEYSFELDQPFFVDTGWQVILTQALSYDWDIRGQVASNSLSYLPNEGFVGPARRDKLRVYGVGVGRRFGIEVRLGVDVTYTTRESNAPGRGYDGFKVGGSVTYGS